MRYSPKLYAKAFTAALDSKIADDMAIQNFLSLIRRNGDWPSIKKILAKTEKLIREKTGRRKVTIETARPLKDSLRRKIHALIEPKDIREEKINLELVAGARITINDETQLDGSLERKLNALFT